MKQILLVLSLLLMTSFIFAAPAKTKGDIKGKIVDKTTGIALEFATVSVLDTAKKVVAGGTTNEFGEFNIQNIPAGQYTFVASFIGYSNMEQSLDIASENSSLKFEKIELSPDATQLEEVVVSARRPTIERQMDKMVMSVANTIIAENSTAEEVLRKAPGVTIDKDGNITLNGQNVEVWVDNRPTQLSGQELIALLSATEGSSIDKIEIIDQPSSKYDAAGTAGIINIKSKKNFLKGFNGSVRAGYAQYLEKEFYYNANGSLNLNYRNDLINTFLNVSARSATGFNDITEDITTAIGFQRYTETKMEETRTNENIKAGIDFFIDKKNIIGVIGNFAFRNRNGDGVGYTQEENSANPESSNFLDDSKSEFLSGTANLNYSHYFDESGHELTANADYMHYVNTPNTKVSNEFYYFSPPSDSTSIYTNNSEQYTDIYSVKADYIKPLGKTMKLELGGKYSWSTTDNTILREDLIGLVWEKNNNLSDDFTYKENIGALYATYAWQISPQWTMKGGLRWEHTSSEGTWRSVDTVTTNSYDDIFPTFYLGFRPAEKHDLSFSYTQRIRRPNYWQLNPFRQYISGYSYIEGNANLKPEYTHRFNLSYTGFQAFNVGLMYSFTNDEIIQIPEYNESTKESGYIQGNFGRNSYFGMWAGVSELPITKWWFFTMNLWGAYSTSKHDNFKQNSFMWNVYSNNTFILGTTWKAELEAWMQGPARWGFFEIKTRGDVNVGVRKTFLEGKGSLGLFVDDIFSTGDGNRVLSNKDGVARINENIWTSRAVRVSFSYRFGSNQQQSRQRNVGQQDEAERIGG